ncbi:MAG: hypothetical protein NTY38_21420 [Acidobacteria bacterium]|nr:hypothetical protein [Acidobacteriota bacterium]
MSHQISATRRRRQRGTWLLEFALCSVFIIPLFLATVGTGLSLSRAIQTTQLCRDAGHMFMDQIDFTNASNQKLIGRLAYGMGMTSDSTGTINTSGNGVVILSTIMMIGSVECANAGYANTASCPNFNKLVITDRIVVGNSALRSSTFGTPSSSIITGDGSITMYNYCTNVSAVVTSSTYATRLNLQAGQFTYVSEAYFISPELAGFNWTGATGVNSTYAYNFF